MTSNALGRERPDIGALPQQLLAEARRIGSELLAAGTRDEHGLSWRTMRTDGKGRQLTVVWDHDESIHSGVAGIALFLIELYRHTSDGEYLSAAADAMRWLDHRCATTPALNYSLFTGRVGVSLAMLRVYEITRDPWYRARALHWARIPEWYLPGLEVDDLINGAASTLLGLLHVYDVSRDSALLPTIDAVTGRLIDRALVGPQGVYWERSPQNVCGQCGFAHGAAGVAFALLELGRYFANPAFSWLAEQGFAYEQARFDPQINNWPDVRRMFFSAEEFEEYVQLYQTGNSEFFSRSTDFNAWCYGAAGIGLARVRGYELTGNPADAAEARTAIAKTQADREDIGFTHHQTIYTRPWSKGEPLASAGATRHRPYKSYTLCHGLGGNAELFIAAAKGLGDPNLHAYAERVAEAALASKQAGLPYQSGLSEVTALEDTSLFRGIAGIGHFYLRVLDPQVTRSVQAPSVPGTFGGPAPPEFKQLATTASALHRRIVSRPFRRTVAALEITDPRRTTVYFARERDWRFDLTEDFNNFARAVQQDSPPEVGARIRDVHALEAEALAMDLAVESNCFLHVGQVLRKREATTVVGLSDAELLSKTLEITPGVRLLTTQWRWPRDAGSAATEQNFRAPDGQHVVLLMPTAGGVLELRLAASARALLRSIGEGGSVADVVKRMSAALDPIPPEHEMRVPDAVLKQVREALLAGVVRERSSTEVSQVPVVGEAGAVHAP